MSNGTTSTSTTTMSIQVNNLPASAELTITLTQANFCWSNNDSNQTNVGILLQGVLTNQGFAPLQLTSASFTLTQIVINVGTEGATSFMINLPLVYPSGTQNPAKGTISCNSPGAATCYMTVAGNGAPQALNGQWSFSV